MKFHREQAMTQCQKYTTQRIPVRIFTKKTRPNGCPIDNEMPHVDEISFNDNDDDHHHHGGGDCGGGESGGGE